MTFSEAFTFLYIAIATSCFTGLLLVVCFLGAKHIVGDYRRGRELRNENEALRLLMKGISK